MDGGAITAQFVPFRFWAWGGVAGGAGGAVAFVVLHAMVIVPIWGSVFSLGALVRIGVGGLGAAWIAYELNRATFSGVSTGVQVGGLLWLLVLPATGLGLIASVLGVKQMLGVWVPVIELALTVALAASIAWKRTARKSAVIALSVTSVVFVALLGGPFPLFVSLPALGLLLGLLPIFLLAGAIQGAVTSVLVARSGLEPAP